MSGQKGQAGPVTAGVGESVEELVGRPQQAHHSLARITIAPGGSSRPHYHPVAEESYHILEGTATLTIDGETTTLSPGDSILIKPPQHHVIANEGAKPLKFLAVCVPAWTPECSVFVD